MEMYLRNIDETGSTSVTDLHPFPVKVTEQAPVNLPATYMASFNHAGVSGDTVEIVGRDGIVIKILEIGFTKPSAQVTLLLIKRRTADSGGTSTNLAVVPLDSDDPLTNTVIKAYTVAPTTGTAVGTVLRMTIAGSDSLFFDFPSTGKLPTLRAANETLALNIDASATVVGWIIWTEEAK